jgi:hypothetical protein
MRRGGRQAGTGTKFSANLKAMILGARSPTPAVSTGDSVQSSLV